MKANAIIYKEAIEENIKLKKDIDKLKATITLGGRRVKLAESIVNRFYKIKPLIIERKGAFRFDKWKEISTLLNLTEKFESTDEIS